MMSFKEPPSVLIVDFAPMVQASLEKRSPGFSRMIIRGGSINDRHYLYTPDNDGVLHKRTLCHEVSKFKI